MNFFETRAGDKFINHTIPSLVRAMDGLTKALEKSNVLAEKKSKPDVGVEFDYILQFIAGEECLDGEVVQEQMRSLWTAYCLHANYDVDTAPYDNNMRELWNAVYENSANPFPDFDAFDTFMCKYLV